MKWRFFIALLVAALWSNPLTSDPYRKLWRAIKAVFGLTPKGKRVSDQQYEARMNCCRQCPIWYMRIGTCSTPLKVEMRSYGCWCFMEEKARMADADCWLDTTLGADAPDGWAKHGVK